MIKFNKFKFNSGIGVVLLFAITFIALSTAANAALQRIPEPPPIKATGYILLDVSSGEVIAKSNANERMEPASLTKMMTSYVIAAELRKGNIKLNEKVKISKKAWKMKGSKMFIEINKKVKVEDLIMGMVVQSGNDATVALAEHVSGTEEEFVKLMNAAARRLGLADTHFVNSTGLPDADHYSTPRDMTYLGLALIRDFPEHYDLYKKKQFTYNGIKQFNRNKLLWKDDSVDGIKTGHTNSAGYCLVASAKRGNMRLVSTVLGTKSKAARTSETQKLLTYGFRFFETHKLYSANDLLTEVKVWKGNNEKLTLGIAEDLYITIPRGQYDKLDANMRINATIVAPAAMGDVYGKVSVNLGTKQVAERDLIALTDIEPGSFWHNLVDSVKLWWKEF